MTRSVLHGIPVLDSLRGFAALSVCLFHFVYSTLNFVDETWVRTIFYQGIFGVQTFFVISGFIIPYSMYSAGYQFRDFFSFFVKRLARLEPPYLFSLVLALAILFLKSRIAASEQLTMPDTLHIALHIGYLIPFFENYTWLNEVYWTLAVEFQFYIFIALFFVPLTRSSAPLRWLLYAGILAFSFVGSYQFLPQALPYFLLGILLFLFQTRRVGPSEFWTATALTSLLIVFRFPPVGLAFGLVTVLGVCFFQKQKVWGLHQLGKFSYSIYLLHPLIGSSIINVLSHRVHTPIQKCGVVSVGLLATLAFSWLMYRLIEQPSQKLSKSITYGQ